jgi:pyruvate/2-oxoglutarate dehydrogenase complex dihydrolipoamide dehydrogenase (E3) component
MRAATSSSTTSCAPAFPASGRSATRTAAARSRTPSFNDHQIVADNLLHGGKRKVSDRLVTYALFTDPPLGRVGMSEAEVRARGKPALVGVMPMTRVGRAKERGETQGFMKVLVDAESERILGAALLCIEGDEIVHSILDVMAADASYKVIERAVHITRR